VTRGIDVIKQLYEAIGRQDLPAVLDLLHDDVRWTVNCAAPGHVPWFGDFRGKSQVPRFFEGLTAARFTDFSPKAMAADGDLVFVWLHVALTAPNGKSVDMSEVHVWQLRGHKVGSVDILEDTAAVRDAMAST
jgi:uncharacterized protein